MTTIITAAGLVGTSFAQQAVRRGEKVVFIDPIPREDFIRARLGNAEFVQIRDDIRNIAGLIQAIDMHEADTLVHSAALIGKSVGNPIHNGYAINIGGTLNAAEAARLTGLKRVVHISTFGVYDWRRITENPVPETAPLGQGTAYSNSKVSQEMIWEAYQADAGFELLMLRLGNVFGMGHFWGGSGGGQKVQDLVMAGITGEPARIPEEQTMDFVYLYSKDTGRAIDLAATIEAPKEIQFNVAYPFVTSFDELVETIRGHLPDLKVEIVPSTPPVNRAIPLDIERAENVLGWKPEFSLSDAFADYIADAKAQMGR
jgi:UDP-glucose 4-epimerase